MTGADREDLALLPRHPGDDDATRSARVYTLRDAGSAAGCASPQSPVA
ncbi:hypothetical protein [Luteimonas salinisoli]|nr:hypothetical protein [Luteimonas salinisoli]